MNYSESLQFLYGLQHFGTSLGLEKSFELAARFGNPHEKLKFIHVAGTNGKGSTCAFLESIYRQAGYRTGLFTSPHLVSFTERIQVNRADIPEANVARLTTQMVTKMKGNGGDIAIGHPTFFEFVTLLALLHFLETACDVVIWETGLGGRLDSTNIVTPLASVITNIQLDHVQWLGKTLREIAREKAGIIKPRVPVVTATQDVSALEVIRDTAAILDSPLTVVDRPVDAPLGLAGDHQKWNAALALATARIVHPHLPIVETNLNTALAATSWPGRLQWVNLPRGPVLLDGAHNPDGAAALVQALTKYFPAKQTTLVLGFFRDKSWQIMCDILLPHCHRVIFAPIQSERSENPLTLRDYARQHFPNLTILSVNSLQEAIAQALGSELTVISGSLHFIGEAMEILRIVPAPHSAPTRGLNEWDAAREKQA